MHRDAAAPFRALPRGAPAGRHGSRASRARPRTAVPAAAAPRLYPPRARPTPPPDNAHRRHEHSRARLRDDPAAAAAARRRRRPAGGRRRAAPRAARRRRAVADAHPALVVVVVVGGGGGRFPGARRAGEEARQAGRVQAVRQGRVPQGAAMPARAVRALRQGARGVRAAVPPLRPGHGVPHQRRVHGAGARRAGARPGRVQRRVPHGRGVQARHGLRARQVQDHVRPRQPVPGRLRRVWARLLVPPRHVHVRHARALRALRLPRRLRVWPDLRAPAGGDAQDVRRGPAQGRPLRQRLRAVPGGHALRGGRLLRREAGARPVRAVQGGRQVGRGLLPGRAEVPPVHADAGAVRVPGGGGAGVRRGVRGVRGRAGVRGGGVRAAGGGGGVRRVRRG